MYRLGTCTIRHNGGFPHLRGDVPGLGLIDGQDGLFSPLAWDVPGRPGNLQPILEFSPLAWGCTGFFVVQRQPLFPMDDN